MNNNPWFWCGMSRHAFEAKMQKDAVKLRLRDSDPVEPKKVDMNAIAARRAKLAAMGLVKNVGAVTVAEVKKP